MGRNYLADIPGNFFTTDLGSSAAIGSAGANARLQANFVAPANLKVLSVFKSGLGANEVTVGTAISSASYRRTRLLNGGTSGTAAVIMASLNATASAASLGSRGFSVLTTTANTATAGAILYLDHLTVGAATADGTDAAACNYSVAYELL